MTKSTKDYIELYARIEQKIAYLKQRAISNGIAILEESERDFYLFLDRVRVNREFALTNIGHSGFLYASWVNGKDQMIDIVFLGNQEVSSYLRFGLPDGTSSVYSGKSTVSEAIFRIKAWKLDHLLTGDE
jgi:hypothetical protein